MFEVLLLIYSGHRELTFAGNCELKLKEEVFREDCVGPEWNNA
jgi:hypothetical protein